MITIQHLEMLDPHDLTPSSNEREDLRMVKVDPPDGQRNKWFYVEVGRKWCWTDRLPWTLEQWSDYASRPDIETWYGQWRDQTIGYCELCIQSDRSVQIAYFGLLPERIGRGWGGQFLTMTTRQAWMLPGTWRVWLHTCSDDHPHALANYKARGFRVFKVEEYPITQE